MIPHDYVALKKWEHHEVELHKASRIALLIRHVYNTVRRRKPNPLPLPFIVYKTELK